MIKNLFNFIALIFLIVLIVSCNSTSLQDSIVKNKIETSILETLDDPSSYEFVNLKLIDSVTHRNNYEIHKSIIDNVPNHYAKQGMLRELNAIKNSLSHYNQLDKVVAYKYILTFNIKEETGEKVLNEVYLQTGIAPEFEIIDVTPNLIEVNITPNSIFKKAP